MSQPSSPTSPTKPKRRNSLKEQWDTTTKVVNVKQKFHSNLAERYTELQKSTFTRWVNIQLRMIDISQLNHSSSPSKKFPEIQAIDKDFRDGKKLIQLLGVLYPDDSELPKLERGRTRHHHIANINKVLEFLQKRLDEKGLIALKAIGPVDIVDGNVKLTLGLIWLMISKFLQMFSVPFEVTEEELEQVEQRIKENLRNKKVNHHHHHHHHHHEIQRFLLDHDDDEEIETFEEFRQQFRSHFVSIEELFNESGEGPGVPDTIYEEKEIDYDTRKSVNDDDSQDPLMMTDSSRGEPSPSPLQPEIEVPNDSSPSPLPPEIKVSNDSTPSPSPSIMEIPNRRLRDLSKSEKRLSLPIFQSTLTEDNDLNARSDKKRNSTSKQFRTLRLSSSPINSNSSNLLFWINMQLIDYASILPPSKYPLEDFIGLNDGFVLSALIQYLNIEWRMDDLDLLNPDDIKMETDNPENLSEEEFHEREIYKEIKAKERLSKCFEIFESKLNVKRPKALISMLIEKDYSDKERLKRTGLAWSVYISEIFLIVSKSKKRRSRLLASNNMEENKVEEKEKGKEKPKEHVIKFLDYDAIYYQSPSNDNQRKQKKSRGCLPFFSSSHDDDPTTLPPWTPPAISLIAMIWEWTLSWLLNDEDDDDEMDFFLGV